MGQIENYLDDILEVLEQGGGGGGGTTVVPLSVTENGTYAVDEGEAYSPVSVNVAAVSKLPQVAEGTLAELTAEDLAGATKIDMFAFYLQPLLESVAIPSSVISIGESAFQFCESLKEITIPSSVTSIGESAFDGCDIRNVVIPPSVTSIGKFAFMNNSNLTNVTMEATSPPTLGSNAFKNSTSHLTIYVPAASVDTYKAATYWSTYASKIQAIPNS